MKEPILLTASHLSAIVTAMLMDRGLDSYTLSLDKFEELNLGDFGLECEGDLAVDGESFTAMTITIRKI